MDNIGRLIPIIQIISECNIPGKKTLQKLIYLIQKKGLDLGFDYSIHHYGPYSSELDYAVHRLEMIGAVEIIPKGMTHRIYTTDLSEVLAEEYMDTRLSDNEIKIINHIVKEFAEFSAFELEIITTTDYIAGEIYKTGAVCDNDSIIRGVRTIKGDKFSVEKINQAINQLKEKGFINN